MIGVFMCEFCCSNSNGGRRESYIVFVGAAELVSESMLQAHSKSNPNLVSHPNPHPIYTL